MTINWNAVKQFEINYKSIILLVEKYLTLLGFLLFDSTPPSKKKQQNAQNNKKQESNNPTHIGQ